MTTNELRRVMFSGLTTSIDFRLPTAIYNVNIQGDTFQVIGMSDLSNGSLLVTDEAGIAFSGATIISPSSVTQSSFVTLSGGTVLADNVIRFTGTNDSSDVQITDVYFENGTMTSNRIVRVDNYTITYSGAANNQLRYVNNSAGNTIEVIYGSTTKFSVDSEGNIQANSKSFLVPHQSKEGYNLRHVSVEGPEHGVYFRGTTSSSEISYPDYWEWLVDFDTVTVQITSRCGDEIYVGSVDDKSVKINNVTCEFDYVVYGERRDILRFDIESKI